MFFVGIDNDPFVLRTVGESTFSFSEPLMLSMYLEGVLISYYFFSIFYFVLPSISFHMGQADLPGLPAVDYRLVSGMMQSTSCKGSSQLRQITMPWCVTEFFFWGGEVRTHNWTTACFALCAGIQVTTTFTITHRIQLLKKKSE